MPNLVCDTSSIQYLHQTGLLHLLKELGDSVCIPVAVRDELNDGRRNGVDLPDLTQIPWIEVVHPRGEKDTRLLSDMGPGEAEVMMLALEQQGLVAVIDGRRSTQASNLVGNPLCRNARTASGR